MTIQEKTVKLLTEKNLKIASAESCTGGLISEMITDVSGASAVFECGVCSYSNAVKMKLLGVKKETIDKYTEVSVQTAEEMAKGVLELSSADISVSTTGVAGPSGGTDENPVGTVCIGIAVKNKVFSEKKNFNFDNCSSRDILRKRCAEYCLEKVCSVVLECFASE